MLAGGFVVLGAVAAVGSVFALQALDVRDDLLEAKSMLGTLPEAVKTGDASQLQAVGAEVLALTTNADAIVQGPLWDAASAIPVVGVNVAAVKRATEATHMLVSEAMPPGLDLLGIMQPDKLKLEGGGVDLTPFQRAQEALPQISAVLSRAQAHVADIERDELLPIVDGAIGQLLSVVDQAGPALDTAERVLPVALQLAGASEPRDYLVVFQNNAEIRATGGNAATSTLIRADNGSIKKIDDETVENFYLAGVRGQLRADLPQETLDLYEWDFDEYSQNFTRTPDFPTSASLYVQLWTQTNGTELDGVISIDPVALSYMLAATGPVPLDDGTEINSENAVRILLSDTYEHFGVDGLAADAFFADVAARVFDKVASGSWDPLAMLDQVQRSVDEQRINAWFAREEEDALATEFHVDGALSADNVASTQVGMYLNDSSYSKLEYYLSTAITMSCDPAAGTMTTSMTLTSTVPGSHLSGYTLAWRSKRLGLPRTTMVLDVLSVAPPGSTILSTTPQTGDISHWDRSGTEKGHPLASRTLLLPMGETKTVSFTSTIPEGDLGPIAVRYSPTVTQTPVTIDPSCQALSG